MVPVNLLAPYESAFGAQVTGSTVTRIVGQFCVRPDTVPGANSQVRIGIGVFPTQMRTVVAANPGPVASPDEDWMWVHGVQWMTLGTGAVTATDFARFHLDLRSRRKITDLDQELLLCAGASGTVAWTFAYSLRVLIMLP
jgi:hypothetical protein